MHKHNNMNDLDVRLVKFFSSILEDELIVYSMATHKESLQKLKYLYDFETFENGHRSEYFSQPAFRCAYMYNFGPIIASTLIHHFRQLFKNHRLLLQTVVLRGNFTICCLSNEFAMDFIAIVTVLQEMLCKYYTNAQNSSYVKRLKIEAVIINTNTDCKKMIEKIAKNLSKMVDMSRVDFKISYLPVDLTKSFTDDVKEVLNKSDFVTMTHFLSSTHEKLNCLQVIQEIVPCIRERGILFFLDHPGFHLCDTLRHIVGTSENMKEIYGPFNYSIHRISVLCMKECLRLYSKHYGWRYCSLESKNYVCAWYKRNYATKASANAISFTRLINDPTLFR